MWNYEVTLLDDTRIRGEEKSMGDCIKEVIKIVQTYYSGDKEYIGHILWKS